MSQKKKIESQHSEADIINVAGNLNLSGGTLQVENLFIGSNGEPDENVAKSEQQILALQYSISYLDAIQKIHVGKDLLDRFFLDDIWKLLNEKGQLILTGQPGVGKTCTFLQLTKYCTPVYISLRDRNPVFAISYLINKIRISKGETLVKVQDVETGLSILEGQLTTCKLVFFIDDLEVNSTLAQQLIAITKSDNLFLYATRNPTELEPSGIHQQVIPALNKEEAANFLKLQRLEVGMVAFDELYTASAGNPLYLYYFSNFQITPFPADIQSYHQSIWSKLAAEAKECLVFSSLSYHPLTLEDLAGLWSISAIEVLEKIRGIAGLLVNQEGSLIIFHPAFKEFIFERVQHEGLSGTYKRKLAEFYRSKDKLVNAAVLLIDEDPAAFNKFGEYCIAQVIISGDLQLAVQFIETLLRFPKTKMREGYLRYHLSYVLRALYREEESTNELELAIALFSKLKNKQWLWAARMIKAMNLIEGGDKEEGLNLADEILKNAPKFGDSFYARALVNLTKIYMDVGEYKKAANTGKQAFDLFEKMNDNEGMVASLANLASSLSQLNDYDDLAEKYALRLLELPEGSVEFGLRMVALNILTSVNRKNKKFTDAKKYGMQAVSLCRQHHLPDKVILNLINYGNIIRDEGDLDAAVKIYEEAMVLVNAISLTREEIRINWILTSLYRQKDEMDRSLAYADKAIDLAEKYSQFYSFAHAWEEKARTLYLMDKTKEAAEAYEKSARGFSGIGQFSKDARRNFLKAIHLYTEAGDLGKANELIAEAITDRPQDNISELSDLIEGTDIKSDDATIHASFLELAKKYQSDGFNENAIQKFLLYVNFCRKNRSTSKAPFTEVMNELARNVSKSRFARTILTMLVDQSGNLIDKSSLAGIISILEKSLPGFYYRETTEQAVFTGLVTDQLRVQLLAFTSDLPCKKMALIMLLFLYAGPELVEIPEKPVAQGYKAMIMSRHEMEASGISLKLSKEFSEHIQTLQMRVGEDATMDTILINRDYEKCADLEVYPNNKCLMYCLGMFVIGIGSHLSGIPHSDKRKDTRPITRKLAFFFDYTDLEDTKTKNKSFDVDTKKLK